MNSKTLRPLREGEDIKLTNGKIVMVAGEPADGRVYVLDLYDEQTYHVRVEEIAARVTFITRAGIRHQVLESLQ